MIASQCEPTNHPLSIYHLAYDFARLRGVNKELDEFKMYVSAAVDRADLKAVAAATIDQSKSSIWRTLRFCRTTASIANDTSTAGAAEELRPTILKKHFGAAKFRPSEAYEERFKNRR